MATKNAPSRLEAAPNNPPVFTRVDIDQMLDVIRWVAAQSHEDWCYVHAHSANVCECIVGKAGDILFNLTGEA